MKLSELKKGSTATIKEVETNCNCVLRVMTLGLIEGSKVTHITSTSGNMELVVHGARIAISKHCASHIVV
jgi:Fe2+ transport system protein FeoA